MLQLVRLLSGQGTQCSTKNNEITRSSKRSLSFSPVHSRSLPCTFPHPGKSKEAEIKRINKELANIRNKFKGDKTLDGYQKKKYVCKLLFIFLLGHDIDFGHMEAVNLLSSNKYSEKQIVSRR